VEELNSGGALSPGFAKKNKSRIRAQIKGIFPEAIEVKVHHNLSLAICRSSYAEEKK